MTERPCAPSQWSGRCLLWLAVPALAALSCTYEPDSLEDFPHSPYVHCFGEPCPDSSLMGTWHCADLVRLQTDDRAYPVTVEWEFGDCQHKLLVETFCDTCWGRDAWRTGGYWTADTGVLRFMGDYSASYALWPGPLETYACSYPASLNSCRDLLRDWELRGGSTSPLADSSMQPDSAHFRYEIIDSVSMRMRYYARDSLIFEAAFERDPLW